MSAAAATLRRDPRLALSRRAYLPRIIGLGLGSLCVAATLYETAAGWPLWTLLAINGLAWPHIARWWTARSREPHTHERRLLLLDTLLGGVWIAAMGFSVLPGAVFATLLCFNNIAVGGLRMLARGLIALGAGATVGWLALDVPAFTLVPSPLSLFASLPLLIIYPLTIGQIVYRQAKALVEQKRLLTRFSRTDGLTGLYNRRHWEVLAERHFTAECPPITLALIALDHFKQINDTFGHAMGDQTLRRAAAFLRETLGDQALVGRYGGEEFGVLLPDTPIDQALAQLDALRERFARREVQGETLLPCTLSIGLAEATDAMNDYHDWLCHADQALYSAKTQGRNRVVAYTPITRSA
ncbi:MULTISPECIES: diguanylate cyclase [Halomonadaceae]|uniref:diguanylate cyclase n=1 Tax=Modicisalibacter zincidurans TaxID=1178777 RepID=A0ABP9R6D1_9GAMM|nr:MULTISPECIES: diguanylate cyclase [Halomonas]MCD6007863.1 diguanylate cyclase [Halomonas sp. IOP_31]